MSERLKSIEGRPKMKITKMPCQDDMIEKLKEAGIYGMTLQSNKMFDGFVRLIADSQKEGEELALAWALTHYEVLHDCPPV